MSYGPQKDLIVKKTRYLEFFLTYYRFEIGVANVGSIVR